MKKKAVVVGAGINGLVASNYLQKNNFDVTLIEKNNYVGGACIKDTIEYNKTDIFELFKICDCVILTCNLNASTFHLVNQNLLENSKKGILIINMSRGSIIDESALIYSFFYKIKS